MILPKPPLPPEDADESLAQYYEAMYKWGVDLVRVMQDAIDELQVQTLKRGEPVLLPAYQVAALLDNAETPRTGVTPDGLYKLVYVLDEAGGAQPAATDGTDFRRLTDRAIVS
jgi:hypothetical protein